MVSESQAPCNCVEMKAYSLIGEQFACNQANKNPMLFGLTYFTSPCDNNGQKVQQASPSIHMILTLTEARGLSRRYILAAAFTRTNTSKLTCLLGVSPRSLECRIPKDFIKTR